MSVEELTEISIQLWGQRGWKSKLAIFLDVDPSTVRRWLGGRVPVPGPVSAALKLAALVQTKL